MQHGQHLRVAAVPDVVQPIRTVEGEDVGEHDRGREGQREPEAAHSIHPAFPHEVDREQREDEEAGIAEVERRHVLIRAERKTEQQRWHLDGNSRGNGQAHDDQEFDA
jgi:hypothetical protein